MAKVEIKNPEIITFEFYQEKGDKDYGTCLWARFHFDTVNYNLNIQSDCGTYGYEWIPTPNKQPFLKLMEKIDKYYLLGKISEMTVTDGDATWENVKEYIKDVLDGEEPDFDLGDVENACYYSPFNETYEAIIDSLENTNATNDNSDGYALFECIETDYPASAKKIVEVFENFIQPKIKELLE